MSIKRIVEDQLGIKRDGDRLTVTGTLSATNFVGDTWYVNGDKSASGNGKSWDRAFKTITEAITASSADDVIFVAPGDYDEGAALAITQENLRIIGPGNDARQQAMIWSNAASHHLMTINAHNVEIAGLGFTQTKDTYDCIQVSTTASYFKVWIHDCRFDGYGQGEHGVHLGTTYDSPDNCIEWNKFRAFQTAAIYMYTTRGTCRHNYIATAAGAIGIHLPATGANRPENFVTDNDILGVNSTDTGITVAAVNAGTLMLSRNHVCGAATSISQFANGQHSGTENYASSTAGGALIDIDS
jgi:hypothetical protein